MSRQPVKHYLRKVGRNQISTESVIVESLMNPERVQPDMLKSALLGAKKIGLLALLQRYVAMDDDIAGNVVWERDQLKQRNQELLRQMEGDRAAYQKDIDAYMKDVDDMARQRDLFEERISKAREILVARIPQSELADAIHQAIEALEGK